MNAPVKDFRVAEYPVDVQFTDRWSPRAFADKAVTEADVLTLIEAARWAPSASNLQPWRFVWALKGDAAFAQIAETLVPFNRDWAGKAAALIVVAARTSVTKEDGTESPNAYHAFDTGAAWGALGLQAHLKGLVAHAMGGFDRDAAAKVVALPEHHAVHAIVAVGYRGEASTLPEGLQSREAPSPRMALSDIAVRGSFAA